MKKDTQKTLLTFLTVLVCLHTVAFFGGFILFKNKFKELTELVVSNMTRIEQGSAAPEQAVKEVNINIPLYEYLGSEEAPVEILIITDFQCPYCVKLTNALFPQITDDYIDNKLVKISYLPYPLINIHDQAMNAAITASYADENDLFWPVHHYLFENSENLSEELMIEYIEEIGLSGEELKRRLKSDDESEKIKNTARTLAKSGISGTPSLVINGKLHVGFKDYDAISRILNQELMRSTKVISNDDTKVIAATEETIYFDVRTEEERDSGFIEGSIHSDFKQTEDFQDYIAHLDQEKSYIIYCKSGFRSTRAYILMEQAGFKDLYNLSGGYDGWKE